MTTTDNQINVRPSTHILAIASLILSILGMLPILPLIGSIAGIVTGIIARREIRSRPDMYSGEGMAKAGIILGWIGIALAVLAVCGILLFLIPYNTSFQPGPGVIVTVQP